MTLNGSNNLPSFDTLFASDRLIQHFIEDAGIHDTVVLMLLPPEAMECAINGLRKTRVKRVNALLTEHGANQQTIYEQRVPFLRKVFGDPKDAPAAALHVTDELTGPSWQTVYRPLRLVRNLIAANPGLTIGQLGDMSCDDAIEIAYGPGPYGSGVLINRISAELKSLQIRIVTATDDYDMTIVRTVPGRGHLRVVS